MEDLGRTVGYAGNSDRSIKKIFNLILCIFLAWSHGEVQTSKIDEFFFLIFSPAS